MRQRFDVRHGARSRALGNSERGTGTDAVRRLQDVEGAAHVFNKLLVRQIVCWGEAKQK